MKNNLNIKWNIVFEIKTLIKLKETSDISSKHSQFHRIKKKKKNNPGESHANPRLHYYSKKKSEWKEKKKK